MWGQQRHWRHCCWLQPGAHGNIHRRRRNTATPTEMQTLTTLFVKLNNYFQY
jgi:hypothetical protein